MGPFFSFSMCMMMDFHKDYFRWYSFFINLFILPAFSFKSWILVANARLSVLILSISIRHSLIMSGSVLRRYRFSGTFTIEFVVSSTFMKSLAFNNGIYL